MKFNFWKKDDIHTLRIKAVELLANRTYSEQKEVIESLVMVYLPNCHIHSNPHKKGFLRSDVIEKFDDAFENPMAQVDTIIGGLRRNYNGNKE